MRDAHRKTCGGDAVEKSLPLRVQELGTAVHNQTEKIDNMSECLTSVTKSMEKILEVQKGQRSSSVLEGRSDADFDQLFKTSLRPILAHLEDLSSQSESKLTKCNTDDWSNASTAESGSVLKLREYLAGSPWDCAENSMLWSHMRAYLADLKQAVVKDIYEQLDEHLSADKIFGKLIEIPSELAPEKAKQSARLCCRAEHVEASPQLTPRGPNVFPDTPMTPDTNVNKHVIMQESEPPRPNKFGFLRKVKCESTVKVADDKPMDLDLVLPQKPESPNSKWSKSTKSKLTMRGVDDDDDTAIQLKLNKAMATVFYHDDNVIEVPFDPVALYRKSGWSQAIARSDFFHKMTDMMIILQAIYLGFESNYNEPACLYESHWSFQIAAQVFIIFFAAEVFIRFLAYEHRRDCLKDGWFKFDVLLVSTMILDVWVVQFATWASGRTHRRFHIQSLRVLRLVKIIRIAKLQKTFPELNLMMKALVGSVRAILSTIFIVSFMLYAWGIFLHMLLRDLDDVNQQLKRDYNFNFATLFDCFWTLLVCGVFQLDNTALIMTDLVYGSRFEEKIAGVAFTTFSLTASLLILQMLIGVLCDVISRIGQEQRDAEAVALVRQEVLGDLYELDAGDGTISQDGLQQVMNSPNSRALLKKLKINRLFFSELANMLYVVPGQNVSIKVIMELLILCRGENTTNVDILSSAFCFLTKELVEMEDRMVSKVLQLERGPRPSAIVDAANLCVGRTMSQSL